MTVSDAWAAHEDESPFWRARPVLQSIEANAYRQLASPWALLGGAITRALYTIPHDVTYASAYLSGTPLNVGVIMLGTSGMGKSTGGRRLDAALPFISASGGIEHFSTHEMGSGEALADAYAAYSPSSDNADREGLVWRRRAIAWTFDEVGKLTALGTRQGSTVLQYLKTAVTGGRLGRTLAGGQHFEIPDGSYRFTLTINAQPQMTAALLSPDQIADGTAGRFLWFQTQCRDIEDHIDPTPVEPYRIKSLAWQTRVIRATPEMDRAHMAEAIAKHKGQLDPIDGHALMSRVKVAIALMRLDGREALSDEDWALSEYVMRHSNQTRATAQLALQRAEREDAAERGRREGVRLAVADDERMRRALESCRIKVRENMTAGKNPAARRNYSPAQWEVLGVVLEEMGLAEEAA